MEAEYKEVTDSRSYPVCPIARSGALKKKIEQTKGLK
jgi:hypothetical protein